MEKEKVRYNPYSTQNALFVSLVIALFQYLLIVTTSFMIYPDRSEVSPLSVLSDVVVSYLASVLLLFLLFKFSFWLAQKNNMGTVKKHLLIFFGLAVLTIPLSLLFSALLDWLLFNAGIHLDNILYKKLMQDMVYAFIVFLVTTSISSIMHNQKVSEESVRNRYEALKNQLDPHFLFNSLNALDGLIGYDDEKAHRYLQKLSQTFRYTIQHKEVTELSEELKLVEAYSYLMKIRFGDNLILEERIEDRYRSSLILPVSLQLLIENAVKHNTINDKHPLTIRIETTPGGSIRVSNNKNPKLESIPTSKIGLANLAERFLLLFGKGITIEDEAGRFSVELPLKEQLQDNPGKI